MEENRKGNVLYLVIGIATLVVAIIGATFAYFSAQASSGAGDIQGGTYNELATALRLSVERVTFEEPTDDGEEGETTTVDYNNLVPAIIDVDEDGIANAVNAKCVADGYTGCHLYKITASSSQTLASVSIRLTKLTTTATDTASWKYVLYNSEDGSESTVSSIVGNSDFATFATTYPYDENNITGFDMHNAGLTGDDEDGTTNPVYYYLLVYLANKDATQNPESTSDTNSGTGTYSGLVTMDAAGGKVVASFSTSTGTETDPEEGA